MNPPYPRVSIIILNWNGLEDTVECLNSLKLITYSNYRVIVVDNNSDNNEAKKLQDRFGEYIHLIHNKENAGFAGGNNAGIRYEITKGTDYILLLNNDTVVESNFLTELVNTAEKNSKIGMVGSKIFYYNSKKIYCLGGGMLNIYTDNYKLVGAKKDAKNFYLSTESVKDQLGYVSGCCMLIKKDLLEQVGLFDENFFVYSEETDLCLRATKMGWKLDYAEKSVIYHKVARSSKYLSGKYVYYMLRNRLYFIRKHSSALFFFLYFITIFVFKNILGYIFLSFQSHQLSENIPYIIKAVKDYFRRAMGKIREKSA